MAAKRVMIIQHMVWEGPGGHLVETLSDLGVTWDICQIWREPLPALESFEGLIVLGGSPNVDEEETYPYLVHLKSLIGEVIAKGKAYLGFCLGHQLLGDVLGCRVGPLPQKCVGLQLAELTPAGVSHPVFAGLPQIMQLFKWHGQGVHLPVPPGVTVLATSSQAPVEAIGLPYNPQVVGVQFDNHVKAHDVAQWLASDADWALAGTNIEPAALISAVKTHETAMGQEFRRFLHNFLELAQLL